MMKIGMAIGGDQACIPLSGEAAGFMTEQGDTHLEDNAIARAPNSLYPRGPRMALTAYALSSNLQSNVLNANMSVFGPQYNDRLADYDGIAQNIRYMFAINGPKGEWGTTREYYPDGPVIEYGAVDQWGINEQGYKNAITTEITRALNDLAWLSNDGGLTEIPGLNDATDIWYGRPDDIKENAGNPTYNITTARTIAKWTVDECARLDPLNRPCMFSFRNDTGGTEMKTTNAATGMVGVTHQQYHIYGNNWQEDNGKYVDPGHEETFKWRAIFGYYTRNMLDVGADAGASQWDNLPHAVFSTLACWDEPRWPSWSVRATGSLSQSDSDLLKKAIYHDVFKCLNEGTHGFSLYDYDNKRSGSIPTQRGYYQDVFRFLTENELDKAYLWGDDAGQVGHNSNETITYNSKAGANTDPIINLRDIRYRDKRFVVVVNSAYMDDAAKSLVISGFPRNSEQVKVTSLLTGAVVNPIDGELSVSLPPLGVLIYQVEVADGYCGGDNPVDPALLPTITSQPQNTTVNVGEQAQFSVVATGADSYQWQFAYAATPTVWQNASAASATTPNLTTAAVSAQTNGNRFRCRVSNTYGTTVSDEAVVTVI